MENKKQLFAVFGKPVLHSKSPQMFNALFSHNDTNAFYTRFRVESGPEVVDAIRNFGLIGANVTTPFKEELLMCLNSVSEEVMAIGSVNTIVHKDGKAVGYNTDYYGVIKAIEDAGISLKGKNAVVLGAGGAGKAAAYGLISGGASVTIVNRTLRKSELAATRLKCNFAATDHLATLLQTTDILVSTILPEANPLQEMVLPQSLAVFDANYRISAVAAQAKAQGCRVIPGERWLLRQAELAYFHFLGSWPDIAIMEKALAEALPANAQNLHCIEVENYKTIETLQPDLVIPSDGKTEMELEDILDEERSKAFGS